MKVRSERSWGKQRWVPQLTLAAPVMIGVHGRRGEGITLRCRCYWEGLRDCQADLANAYSSDP
ncbi:hypothetical protein E2C01_018776 [Portunus trituberculatus]|uniref:Uncharacterized protein n=1 Tax=Portunus trituberculatus TaxID=210409 RepID=A0A5B7DY05_PORTR|nr:hypothetical protein [Portunus trituberculatus]